MKKIISTAIIFHRGENRLALYFQYDTGLKNQIKEIPGARWSQTKKCWHVPVGTNLKSYITGDGYLLKNVEGAIERAVIENDIKKRVIYITTGFNREIAGKIRSIHGIWNSKLKKWTVYYSKDNLQIRTVLNDFPIPQAIVSLIPQ